VSGWIQFKPYYIYIMQIPKLLILIFLLAIANSSFGQKLNKIEREYFILGTLSDDSGHDVDPREENLFDRYYSMQEPLITVIDSLLKKDYLISAYKVERYLDSTGNFLSGKIFSDTLLKRFDVYYTFKENGTFTSDNDPKLNNKPILMRYLKTKIFDEDSQKLAFLAGTYVRFGLANDTAYEISIPESFGKAKICYNLLVNFKCKATYQVWQDHIPTGYHVYFHPSQKIKAYLQQFMYLRKRLDEAERIWFEREINESKHK